ncbi:zinc finger protein 425-like [Vespula maculifrons]|uniref:Zinc finger protein 425-like n=1 Tax=Vespula maculifrons TaxID=7453 RepID=A0ABD2C0C4_VESMC
MLSEPNNLPKKLKRKREIGDWMLRRCTGRRRISMARFSSHGDFILKPFPCHQCHRSYKNKGSLKRHLEDECGKEPKYICTICDKGFHQKANFKRHKSTIHEHI